MTPRVARFRPFPPPMREDGPCESESVERPEGPSTRRCSGDAARIQVHHQSSSDSWPALADGPVHDHRCTLRSRDADLMIAALRDLGIGVEEAGDATTLRITPGPLRGGEVDCGLGRHRDALPAATRRDGRPASSTSTGDEQARTRPLGTILEALRGLGARIEGDALPFTVTGTGSLRGGTVTIDASGSSQFVSGLLLSAAAFEEGVTVHHDGKPVPSMPHIDMTVEMLREAGVSVTTPATGGDADTWRVAPGPVRAVDWAIEPDLSNATPFLAAAAVTGGTVSVPLWPSSTTQPGDAIRGILASMGADVTLADGVLTVPRPGETARHRHRPPRRGRADPHRGGPGRSRRGHLASTRESRTCAGMRQTVSPPSPTRSTNSAAPSPKPMTA